MDLFLSLSRKAFRSLYGLPLDCESAVLPDEKEGPWQSWARRHRVQGLLYAGLPEAGHLLQTGAFGQAQHTARYTHEAERLTELLTPSIPSLAFQKGPALAIQSWPDPGLRSFDDLDIVCGQRDYARLVAGMKDAGYVSEIPDAHRRAHRWQYGWSIAFHHPDGFMVEANHRFFPPQYPWPGQLDGDPSKWMIQQPLDERAVCAPAPALHLLLCCMHAIWHGWARLAWLVDIAGLLTRHPETLAQAKTLAARCPFAQQSLVAGCGIASALFGDELTPGSLPPVSEKVIQQAFGILSGTARQMSGGELRQFHEQFMTPLEKALYRMKRVCIPGDGDFLWISLPVPLRGLYWLLRPTRVLLYGKTGY